MVHIAKARTVVSFYPGRLFFFLSKWNENGIQICTRKKTETYSFNTELVTRGKRKAAIAARITVVATQKSMPSTHFMEETMLHTKCFTSSP